ncbi:MAG: nucleotidyltransferase domain-containing protein [Bacteroidota bacterium]
MQAIQEQLKQIEKQKGIKILYACETGSRAWGFPSPDSDFDIRFLYMHDKDWYLSLGSRKDTIETMQGDFDITGWDLRKSLVMLKKSNTALIERFQSPIEYYAAPGFKDDFRKLVAQFYTPVAVFYHHYSLAKKFWEDIKDSDEIKLKAYFYLVRSLLSCNWITKCNDVLPMDIEGLMSLTTEGNRTILRNMVQLKATVGEKYLHQKDAVLQTLVTEFWDIAEAGKNNLGTNSMNYSSLDAFFLKTLYANTNH